MIELIISISMISIVLFISTTLYLDSLKHNDNILSLGLSKCEIDDLAIDIKNRLNNESIEYHEVSRKQIISRIKKTTSYNDFFVIKLKNNKLIQEKYSIVSGNLYYPMGETIISRNVKDITFYNKGKLIYAKVNINGAEDIIWL